MALGQGMIFTTDEMRKALRDNSVTYRGTNSWTDAYGSIEAQKQNALGQLGNEYDKEILDAYVASQRQASAIQASNLFEGYKDLALQENQQVLNDAFESYRNTYLQNKANIESNASNYMNAVNEELSNVASNYSKLGNMAWQYLPYLYEKDPELFKNDINYSRYLVDDGTGNFRLKTMGELGADFIENERLNEKGIDFLNFIEGYNFGGTTFWDFVAEKDYDLFEWANSADPYNVGKRNVDTFRYFTGEREEGTWSPERNPETGMPTTTPTGEQFVKNPIGVEMNNKYDSLMTSFANDPPKNWKEAAAYMDQIGALQEELKQYANEGYADEINAMLEQWKYLYDVLNGTKTDKNPNPTKIHSNKSLAHIISSALDNYQQMYNKITGQTKAITEVTKSEAQEEAEHAAKVGPSYSYTDDTPESTKNLDLPDNQFTRFINDKVAPFVTDPFYHISKWLGLQN